MTRLVWLPCLALSLTAALAAPSWAQDLYDFGQQPTDGQRLLGGVIMDATGAIYGTAFNGGTTGKGIAYKLTQPANAAAPWVEQILWNFGAVPGDGAFPQSALLMSKAGALYAVLGQGGAANVGAVCMLLPPAAGGTAWTETVIHSFGNNSGGDYPSGAVIMDQAGALYGVASSAGTGGGTVYKLVPPPVGQTQWDEQVLYTFSTAGLDGAQPNGKLAMDKQGNLFGTTTYGGSFGQGVVFEVSPPPAGQIMWTEKTLYTFSGTVSGGRPLAGLAISGRDVLYGTTMIGGAMNFGTVYGLTPPAGGQAWHFDLIHTFTGSPDGATTGAEVTLDALGNLYGSTPEGGNLQDSIAGDGIVFKLTRPSTPGGVWAETTYLPFNSEETGVNPQAEVLIGKNHLLYDTANGGYYGGGVVFKLSPGQLK